MTTILLTTSDQSVIDAVKATSADPQIFQRVGQVAASGQLETAGVVLFGPDTLTTLAAVGVPTLKGDIAVVFTVEPTRAEFELVALAEIRTVLVLPKGGEWIHDRVFGV